MATQRQEGMRGGQGQYPERLGQPDCRYYMRTGVCAFARACRFNHPPQRQLLTRANDEYPERLGQPACQHYLRTGTCKFGATCKYDHPRQKAGSTGRVQLNAFGLSMRQGEKECAHYMRTGSCKFGETCKFHHPQRATLGWNKCQISEAHSIGNTAKNQSEPATQCIDSEYHTASDTHSQDTRPSCSLDSSSSALEYFSTIDVVQRDDRSRKELNSKLQKSEAEAAKALWSELSSNNDAAGYGESNREIYERLRQEPKYRKWLQCDVAAGDILLGPIIAEGGQAEIFDVEYRSNEKRSLFRCVLKVFKEGYSLQDLKVQWPEGLLFEGHFSILFWGGMVLDDDRFALLLFKSDIDLRQLIDVTLDENAPLFDQHRRPRLKELRTYKPQRARSECSSPVFSDQCAQHIMYHIACEMKYLHSVGVLHRDLKASNILCSSSSSISNVVHGINITVADFESSIGVAGTGFWRAPEILKQLKERQRQLQFTSEADVYSFAMTCYEIWTGQVPFEGHKPNDYEDVLNGVRPSLPDFVPAWVKDLIQRCWHPNPSARPSFSAIVTEMESVLGSPLFLDRAVLERARRF